MLKTWKSCLIVLVVAISIIFVQGMVLGQNMAASKSERNELDISIEDMLSRIKGLVTAKENSIKIYFSENHWDAVYVLGNFQITIDTYNMINGTYYDNWKKQYKNWYKVNLIKYDTSNYLELDVWTDIPKPYYEGGKEKNEVLHFLFIYAQENGKDLWDYERDIIEKQYKKRVELTSEAFLKE